MEVISIRDLEKNDAKLALKKYRERYNKRCNNNGTVKDSELEEIYDSVGGRLAFLKRVANSPDMLKMCKEIIEQEKTWLLNQCGLLGSTMDDDGKAHHHFSFDKFMY